MDRYKIYRYDNNLECIIVLYDIYDHIHINDIIYSVVLIYIMAIYSYKRLSCIYIICIMHIYIYIIYLCICKFIYIGIYKFIYIQIYIYMCVCVCVCVYIMTKHLNLSYISILTNLLRTVEETDTL